MRTQRHPHNFIWLLLLVWLTAALASYAFSYTVTVDTLNVSKQDTLRVYTENDDVALEEQKELQEKHETAALRTIGFVQLLCELRDCILIAFAILAGFIPLHIFRYYRRRTRTPSPYLSLSFLPIH